MARQRRRALQMGFSMVEMMVALLFTMILMAGMSQVFKGSLSTFYTSGEALSSFRRNRVSMDLLGADLHTACMYLIDPATSPKDFTATNPGFYILPSVPVVGVPGDPRPGDPLITDELYFYLDQPLPFEGVLGAPAAQQNASEMAMSGLAPTAADFTYTVDCGNAAYAAQVKAGMNFIFKDQWSQGQISGDPSRSNGLVTVVAGADPKAAISGQGPSGLPSAAKHIPGSAVLFYLPSQMVRYRIEYLFLDPQKPEGIPCLIRDQGNFTAAGFAPDPALRQVITENVFGFNVYLSCDSGQNWAGYAPGTAPGYDLATGWTNGIMPMLDAQIAASGRPDFTSTASTPDWFRSIPTLVRLDIITRTATERSEYSRTAGAADYQRISQSLVFVPRHSGLAME